MFKEILKCLRSGCSPVISSRFVLLFLLTICLFADSSASRALNASTVHVEKHKGALTQNAEVTRLSPGESLSREISKGQKQSYQIDLTEGQFADVEIGSTNLSSHVTVFDGRGEAVAEYNVNQQAQAHQAIEIVAEATGSFGLTIESKAKDSVAQTYTIHLVLPRPASNEELWTFQARRLHLKASALIESAKFDEAQALEEQALVLREKALGPESAAVANALHQLGIIYYQKGDYPKAEAAFLRAIKIRETTSGLVSNDVFELLSNLGGLYNDMGELDKAEQVLQHAMAMQQHLPGLDELRVAAIFNNLALVCYAKGDYIKAEPLFERALTVEEKAFGPNSSELTDTLDNLSALYQAMGNYSKADSFSERSLSIEEKAFGPDDPRIASTLLNLANDRYLSGELEQAEPLYNRGLQIYEKALGPEHPLVALALNNLAEVYHDRREFARAEPLYLRSLAIREKKLGLEHSDVGQSLNNLGNLYRDEGDFDKAEEFYTRALLIREKALGTEHPDVVSTLSHMALMYMARGDFAKAESFQARAINISERNASLNLVSGSEPQKLAYLDSLSEQLDRAITLNVKLAPEQKAARDLAITTVLQRKGRVLDVLSDNLASLRTRLGVEDLKLLDRFNETTSHLSRLVFGGPQQQTTEEFQKRVSALSEQRGLLEAEISRRSAEFRAQSQIITIAAVQAALPDNAAMLEFVTYRPLAPKGITAKERYGEPRYVVYVIRARGEVAWKELGDAKAIDKAIDALRQALRDPQRKDAQQLARAVEDKVMQPVRALLGDTTQLIVSPDGELNLIPLAALVDEQGRYLIERYSISYLTSGRDLLRMKVDRAARTGPLVVADPSFGEPANEALAKGNVGLKSTTRNSRRRSVTTGKDLSEVYFAPLDGTSQEAHSIQTLFSDTSVLTGAQATESAVKQVNAPRILHLATHGFFLSEPGARGTGSVVQVSTRTSAGNGEIENPLLRSGLALAGANLHHSAANDDGILTALEASNLNLWGTKLVVLSACDTGVGAVRNGEGVYGLRRAFVIAGAESLVMSLWPISDYSTRLLMTNYYKNLKLDMGRGEALRQVQLDMLKKNPHLHPFYWANFIQAGDWTSLDHQR
jgi:CHAT domain-containing protein/Tfp pilus assembly protein PilF